MIKDETFTYGITGAWHIFVKIGIDKLFLNGISSMGL